MINLCFYSGNYGDNKMSANEERHEKKLHTIPTQATKNGQNPSRVPLNFPMTSSGSPKPLH